METTTMEGHHHREFEGVTEHETGEIGNGVGWGTWPAGMLTWGLRGSWEELEQQSLAVWLHTGGVTLLAL